MIKFVAEYKSDLYNYLVLMEDPKEVRCTKFGCDNSPNCIVYDPEGDTIAYCIEHALKLDQDPDWDVEKSDGNPDDIVIEWIKANRGRFVTEYDPEQAYNF